MQDLALIWSQFGPILINVIILIALLLIYKLISRGLKVRYIKIGFSSTSANAIILIIRIIFIIVAISVTFSIVTITFPGFGIDLSVVIPISTLIATAIGLASAQALSNVIAGFYVLITRPFQINDYVKIGTDEGIIKEITLTYSRIKTSSGSNILIPNSKVVTSNVTNYKITKSKLTKLLNTSETEKSEEAILEKVKHLLKSEKTYFRYTFDIPFKVDWNLEIIEKAINKIIKKWEKTFGYPPLYVYNETDGFKHFITFSLIVEDPELILDKKGIFQEEIIKEAQYELGINKF